MTWTRKRTVWIVVTAIVTALVVLLLLNLMPAERRIQRPVEQRYPAQSQQFHRTMSVLLGPPIAAGNRVKELINGDEIFPAMLEAIRRAKRTITFETYIYWSGDVGREFADALAERARNGVRVHVLLDWVGSQKIEESLLDTMRGAGVEIRYFRPLHWYHLARLNNRTHRKLLVVDGRIGFTGGVGIADKWQGHAQDPDHWRDSHFRAEGPVVAQMQATFIDNWTAVTGEVLHGEDYLPSIAPAGDAGAQMFSSSPEGGAESMQLMYLLSIAAATRSIDLSNSYFVPDELAIVALEQAAARGVKVRVIVPGPIIDTEVVRRASRATWGRLLEAGVEIFEYQPTMYHVKVLIVDGLMVSVGSTNFDPRSFRLNDEANLNIYDAAFAARQVEVFEADLAKSRRVTLEEWRSRPWHEKLVERASSLLATQL